MRVSTEDMLYRAWCKNYQHYQAQTTQIVRKIVNRPVLFNFNFYRRKNIDKIFERYEKKFW
jgi:hypothetical protein